MTILCAVLAAAMFGAGHYMSGTVSRRVGPATVAYWTQFGVVAVAAVLLLARPLPEQWSIPALAWGTVAAIGGVAGSLFLYKALSKATFTLAVGASTVTTTVTPAIVALLFLGEQITVLRIVLILLAVLTVWLLVSQRRSKGVAVVTSPLPVITSQMPVVSAEDDADSPAPEPVEHTGPSSPGAGLLALGAGLGYATELVGVAQIPQEDFAQGLLAWAVVSFLVMLVMILLRRGPQAPRLLPQGGAGALVILAGGFSAFGMLLFHISAAGVGLATTSAIVAVYPAVPILLAVLILRERPSPRGWAGLACAGLVVALGAYGTSL
ncbi:EamA family transporter [Nesterenkonia sp. MY13]|uniref:EamA family transporter n=1 Tax=Nesterenkonia sedimenti TaxID=1463632 RepID=A0A7X8TLP0_9MICC|nr:EamA family transporter [Nesterenkonia sedimenti]NLS10861.1 EamA family transporter [Nesterenkonia sedimenti]